MRWTDRMKDGNRVRKDKTVWEQWAQGNRGERDCSEGKSVLELTQIHKEAGTIGSTEDSATVPAHNKGWRMVSPAHPFITPLSPPGRPLTAHSTRHMTFQSLNRECVYMGEKLDSIKGERGVGLVYLSVPERASFSEHTCCMYTLKQYVRKLQTI